MIRRRRRYRRHRSLFWGAFRTANTVRVANRGRLPQLLAWRWIWRMFR